ncbi:unnamed protein product [Auanema sp. JU1783]|nr:unnamed protein product [Auanema sp. JU1783]
MSSAPGTGASQPEPYVAHKWLFSSEEMKNAKSISEGFTEGKELYYRQLATRFIQVMVDRLNEAYKDRMGPISQYCMCAATIHMHRFYYFHSFNVFDYKDIAAAALFLSGKSEESPRKLEDIVRVWWEKKYTKHPVIPPTHIPDARAYIVQLENIILHTIAFDLQVDLPHPVVLNVMHQSVGQAVNDHGNKKLTKCAYFFATDVLCVTNWAIRYSAAAIAICCVHIVCAWCRHEIPKTQDGSHWFSRADPTMTEAVLKEMADEFVQIYHSCKGKLAFQTSKYLQAGAFEPTPVPGPGSTSNAVPISPTPLLEPLPPPPPPPSIPRKVDLSEYKERVKLTPKESEKAGSTEKPRKSFIPDTSQVGKMRELPTISLPGMEPLPKDSKRDERRDEERRKEREKDKEKRREEKERRRDEKPEDKDRRREEEKRKREHERSAGHGKDGYGSYKKPRTDVMPSSTHHSVNTNGYHKGSQSNLTRISSDKPLSSSAQHPMIPRISLAFEPTVALSPPPPAPSLPQFPTLPTRNELEDGEVDE